MSQDRIVALSVGIGGTALGAVLIGGALGYELYRKRVSHRSRSGLRFAGPATPATSESRRLRSIQEDVKQIDIMMQRNRNSRDDAFRADGDHTAIIDGVRRANYVNSDQECQFMIDCFFEFSRAEQREFLVGELCESAKLYEGLQRRAAEAGSVEEAQSKDELAEEKRAVSMLMKFAHLCDGNAQGLLLDVNARLRAEGYSSLNFDEDFPRELNNYGRMSVGQQTRHLEDYFNRTELMKPMRKLWYERFYMPVTHPDAHNRAKVTAEYCNIHI